MKKPLTKTPRVRLDAEGYRQLQRKCWRATDGDAKRAAARNICRYITSSFGAILEGI